MTVRRSLSLLAVALASACAGAPDDPKTTAGATASTTDATTTDAATGSASMSSTSKGSTTADVSGTEGTQGTEGTTLTSTSTDTGDTSSDSNPVTDGCNFLGCGDFGDPCQAVPGLDGVPRCSMCDVWSQDCSEGEKCSAWANDGGMSWNATVCVPVGEGQPGEPCTVEGSPASGHDSCALGAMCWDVDPDTLEGTCVGLCDGSPDAPTCAEPETACVIANDGVLNLCLPTCDPILQDCEQTESCVPFGEAFHCFPVAESPGGYGDPCEFIAACDHGLACIQAEEVPGCEATGCCSPFCETDQPNICPGMPEQSCVPWFEPGEAPVGLEDLGVCAIP